MTIQLPPSQVVLKRTDDGGIDEDGGSIELGPDTPKVAGFDCTYQDGYDWIDTMAGAGWTTISSWGRDGWDLGDWPYVVISVKSDPDGEGFGYCQRCEGDLDVRWFATRDELFAHIDTVAAWYWEHLSNGPDNYDPNDPKFKGPFSWKRLEREKESA